MTGIKLAGKTGKDGREYQIRKKVDSFGTHYGVQSVDAAGVERSTAFITGPRGLVVAARYFNEK